MADTRPVLNCPDRRPVCPVPRPSALPAGRRFQAFQRWRGALPHHPRQKTFIGRRAGGLRSPHRRRGGDSGIVRRVRAIARLTVVETDRSPRCARRYCTSACGQDFLSWPFDARRQRYRQASRPERERSPPVSGISVWSRPPRPRRRPCSSPSSAVALTARRRRPSPLELERRSRHHLTGAPSGTGRSREAGVGEGTSRVGRRL